MIEELAPEEIDAFLREQVVARIGCHAGGETYVVPVIYAWDGEAAYVFSIEGRKIGMMRENPRVCLEVDAYSAGGGWRSVIVQGVYEELDGGDAARARELLVERLGRRPAAEGDGERRGGGAVPVAFRIRSLGATGRTVARE